MMKGFKMALMGGCLALSGCAGPVVLNYSPSSTMSVKGTEKVGAFDYAPAKGGKIKPNQIRNTAAGNIFFEKPIHDYFEKAMFIESRFVGIEVGENGPVVHGTIDEFLIDDLGYSVDWTLNVTYVVDKNDGSTCFKSQKKLARNTNKFANAFGTLNEIVKDNIELLFKDPAFVTCITPHSVADVGAPVDRITERGTVVSPMMSQAPTPVPASAQSAESAKPALSGSSPADSSQSGGAQGEVAPTAAANPGDQRPGRPLSYIRLR